MNNIEIYERRKQFLAIVHAVLSLPFRSMSPLPECQRFFFLFVWVCFRKRVSVWRKQNFNTRALIMHDVPRIEPKKKYSAAPPTNHWPNVGLRAKKYRVPAQPINEFMQSEFLHKTIFNFGRTVRTLHLFSVVGAFLLLLLVFHSIRAFAACKPKRSNCAYVEQKLLISKEKVLFLKRLTKITSMLCLFKTTFSRRKFPKEKWFLIDSDKCAMRAPNTYKHTNRHTPHENEKEHPLELKTKHIHHFFGAAISELLRSQKYLNMSNVFCNHLIVFKFNLIQLKQKLKK